MNKLIVSEHLKEDLKRLIEESRYYAVQQVNASLITLNWKMGQRIQQEILQFKRADYGESVIEILSVDLKDIYPNLTPRYLRRMVQFYTCFPDEKTILTSGPQLSWSHFVELLSLDDDAKRRFYFEVAKAEKWGVRDLRRHIQSQMYERAMLSGDSEGLLRKELRSFSSSRLSVTDLIVKDPYLLDFLQLPGEHTESDLENAILTELCKFLQELGNDFCFVARQKRMSIGKEDFWLDLLFFHRGLSQLVALELKIGKFSASYKGQMELYLGWLNKYERKPNEKEPIGIILCTEKDEEQIELLEMKKSKIHVAKYITQFPDKGVFQEKLERAIEKAQALVRRIE